MDYEQARFFCLEYTVVLSIFLLLSVIMVFMSFKPSYFTRFKTVFFPILINKMKENHHSENRPQTTWLNV